MKLKNLTLQGYKTFASKTDFVFDEGLTAIVGPNGSGKSNIADALRWVLGEQSYGTLRGKRTVDMIFAGSRTRPRAGMAQASLTLDNSDNWLPIDYSEVEIGRRAYRSGENEYLLNGQKVRLKDISQLLATSGLSERTYTIIGQGLIDRALSLRADERRALFEEAAGINHYKSRRAETLRRLKETQHNLERVHDILAEIRPRLRSLKRQATRARNYEQINQDLKHLLRIWYGFKWDQSRRNLREAREAADIAEKAWQESRHGLLVHQKNLDDLQQQINRTQRRRDSALQERDDVREKLEMARREVAILQERRASIERQLENIEVEVPLLSKQQENAQEQLLQATNELSAAQSQLTGNQEKLSKYKQAVRGHKQEVNKWRIQLANAEKQKNERQTRIAKLDGQISQIRERLQENASKDDQDSSKELEHLESDIEQQSASLSAAQDSLKQIKKERDELQNKRRDLIKSLKALRQEVKKQGLGVSKQRSQVARLEARVDLLDQLRHKDVPVNKDVSLVGTVASQIEIPPEHQMAIESALESRLAALVVEDEKSLWQLIKNDSPQSIYILSSENVFKQDISTPIDNDGVIGWASEFVSCGKKFQPIVNLIFGTVLLVDDQQTAFQLASALPTGTMAVAQDGLVAYAGGLISTPNTSKVDGILSREAAWQEAQEALHAAKDDVLLKEKSENDKQATIQKLQDQVDHIQNEDRRLGRDENELLQKISANQRKVDRIRQQQGFIKRQTEQVQQDAARLKKRIVSIEEQISADNENIAELNSKIDEARTQLDNLPILESQQEEQSLQQRVIAAETIVAGRRAVVDSRRTSLSQTEERLERLNRQKTSLVAQLENIEGKDTFEQLEELRIKRSTLEAAIKPIQSRLDELQNDLSQQQIKTAEKQNQAHDTETRYTQTQVKLTQQESQIESLQERIQADLGLVALRYDKEQTGPKPLPISDVVEQLPQLSTLPEDIEEQIHQYRGQLQRMGGINPDAPSEFAATQDRHDFLNQQIEDLEQTEKQLRQVISELDELTSRAFAETVERVNGVFGDTFTQLFGGGSARLVLTDPDDLTISGVDIVARLPNRREQGLGLLSGGERSLTASALIFSLLKVSPTPFCVMDEVDAALDEANIHRFREILRELSLKTQFIIITHNRGTVQAAQTIYGVSMMPDSASQVISIRPEEYLSQEEF